MANLIQQIAAAFLPPSDAPAATQSPDETLINVLPYYRTSVARVDGTIGARRSTPRELATVGYVDVSSSNNKADANGIPNWAANVVGPAASQFNYGANSFLQQIAQFLTGNPSPPSGGSSGGSSGGGNTTVSLPEITQPVYNPVSPPPPPPPPPPPVTTMPFPIVNGPVSGGQSTGNGTRGSYRTEIGAGGTINIP